MFDLEQEIRRWRRAMRSRLPLDRDAVRELEAHLRDAVQDQLRLGKTAEEALSVALEQLGSPDALAAEYAKLPMHAIWRWRPAQVVLGTFAVVVLLLVWLLKPAAEQHAALLNLHVIAITIGYLALFAVGAIAAWCVLSQALRGWSPLETEVLRATMGFMAGAGGAITLVGVVLGSFWAHDHLGRFWGWHPKEIAATAILAWYLLMGWLMVRGCHPRVMMLSGLTGAMVVALGWLAPAALSWRQLAPGLAVLATVELIFFGLAFLPPGRLRFRSAA